MFKSYRSLLDTRTSLDKKPTRVRPRVLVADDHQSWRDRVISKLDQDFDLVGTVNDGRELIVEAQRLQPDIIVLDIEMPVLNGIKAAHELHVAGSNAKLLFLTVHEEPEYVSACFAEGGLGYVKKSRLATDLIPAIHDVLLGRRFISPSLPR
jgi:DNA-binding NarL/FixJ family response regulator